MPVKKRTALRLRFEQGFQRGAPDECWPWLKARTLKGYGRIYAGRQRLAHQISYELYVGSIPFGLEIDHKCENKWCVNPAHLEVKTKGDHTKRHGPHRPRSSHCKRGHALTPESRIEWSTGTMCRICHNAGKRARRKGITVEEELCL